MSTKTELCDDVRTKIEPDLNKWLKNLAAIHGTTSTNYHRMLLEKAIIAEKYAYIVQRENEKRLGLTGNLWDE